MRNSDDARSLLLAAMSNSGLRIGALHGGLNNLQCGNSYALLIAVGEV